MINAQWIVDVQLYEYEILYNVELLDGQYCCCGDSPIGQKKCFSESSDWQREAEVECQQPCSSPLFSVHLSDGPCPKNCSLHNKPFQDISYTAVMHFLFDAMPTKVHKSELITPSRMYVSVRLDKVSEVHLHIYVRISYFSYYIRSSSICTGKQCLFELFSAYHTSYVPICCLRACITKNIQQIVYY